MTQLIPTRTRNGHATAYRVQEPPPPPGELVTVTPAVTTPPVTLASLPVPHDTGNARDRAWAFVVRCGLFAGLWAVLSGLVIAYGLIPVGVGALAWGLLTAVTWLRLYTSEQRNSPAGVEHHRIDAAETVQLNRDNNQHRENMARLRILAGYYDRYIPD